MRWGITTDPTLVSDYETQQEEVDSIPSGNDLEKAEEMCAAVEETQYPESPN